MIDTAYIPLRVVSETFCVLRDTPVGNPGDWWTQDWPVGKPEVHNPEVGKPEVGNPEVDNPEVGNLLSCLLPNHCKWALCGNPRWQDCQFSFTAHCLYCMYSQPPPNPAPRTPFPPRLLCPNSLWQSQIGLCPVVASAHRVHGTHSIYGLLPIWCFSRIRKSYYRTQVLSWVQMSVIGRCFLVLTDATLDSGWWRYEHNSSWW